MLGELIDTVENMVAGGGSDLASAITNVAQEMRDTLADIQSLDSEDIDDEDTDEFDEALDEEEGDDCCDNSMTSGIACSQTCPDCGKTLCAECAADNEGRCSECASNAEGTGDDEPDEDDEAGHADH